MNPTSGKTGNARARRTAVAQGCLVALAACGKQSGTNQPPQAGDLAVATVDGQSVWASELLIPPALKTPGAAPAPASAPPPAVASASPTAQPTKTP